MGKAVKNLTGTYIKSELYIYRLVATGTPDSVPGIGSTLRPRARTPLDGPQGAPSSAWYDVESE